MKQSTKQRNWDICQLRGILPRLVSLIPIDIKFSKSKRERLNKLVAELLTELNNVKVKRFTCSKCSDTTTLHVTRDKRAYSCDYCGKWSNTPLYNIKRPKCL